MLYKDEIYIEQKFEQVKFVDSYGIAQDCLTYKIDRLDRFYDIGKNEHIQYNNKLGITIWNARTSMFLNVEKSDIMPKKNVTKKIEKDKKDYIDYIIEKCESQKSFINKWFIDVNIPDRDQSDKLFTVRLSIKKDYPGVLKYFDERNPTNLDVVNKIENVIRFYINDNNSFGNSDNTAKFAYKYLEVSGYTELPVFNAAWELLAGLYRLPGSKELFDENCLDEDIVL